MSRENDWIDTLSLIALIALVSVIISGCGAVTVAPTLQDRKAQKDCTLHSTLNCVILNDSRGKH